MKPIDNPPSRPARVLILAAGALVTQALVLWPSLFGGKVLLPLDVLASPNLYLPATDPRAAPADMSNGDPVVQYEPWRRFAASELRSGRIPLWFPYGFAGAPFALWPKYSPFNLLYYAWPSTGTLVYMHLLAALVASAGAYAFFRRCLRAGFWPSAVGSWAYPLSGHFVLWLAFPVPSATAWLPWLLWAAERSARRPRGAAPVALALLAGVVLVSGLTDWTLLSLLTAALYALWCAWRAHRRRPRVAVRAGLGVAAALATGALLAAPYLLPMTDYVRSGARYAARLTGRQDRPPLGLRALPQVVLPRLYGSSRPDQVYTLPGNRREGAPSAYAGLALALVLAPWSLRRRPRILLLPWLALTVLGVAAIVGIPGLVQLFRLPFVNLVSYNRFTFATGFALLCLAVIGLGQVGRRTAGRAPLLASLALLATTGGWALWYRSQIPQAVATRLTSWPYSDRRYSPTQRAGLDDAQRGNVAEAGALVLCGIAAAVALGRGVGRRPWARVALGVLAVAELAGFAARDIQHGDPSLDYPAIPNVTSLAAPETGRLIALGCLPPNVLSVHGLRDARGYDAVDPARYLDLLLLALDRRTEPDLRSYARSILLVPRFRVTAGQADVPGVLDMLGVDHIILPPDPASTPSGYVVVPNPEALPRAWVPESVKDVGEGAPVLARLGAPRFDPRRVAFAEGARPQDGVRGQARVASEAAGRMVVDVEMETPGLLVVSTLWDEGWHATVSGRPALVLRTNHALQGVPLEPGLSRVVLAYEPPGFRRGVELLLLGGLLVGFAALAVARRRTATA